MSGSIVWRPVLPPILTHDQWEARTLGKSYRIDILYGESAAAIHSGAWSPTIGLDGQPLPHDLQMWVGRYANFDEAARAALLKAWNIEQTA